MFFPSTSLGERRTRSLSVAEGAGVMQSEASC